MDKCYFCNKREGEYLKRLPVNKTVEYENVWICNDELCWALYIQEKEEIEDCIKRSN